MATRITIKQLSESIEKLTNELSQAKRTIAELETKVNSNNVTISRFKIYIDEKVKPVDIEAEVKKLMTNKEAFMIGMREEVVPMTRQSRAAAVYKAYRLKQQSNDSHETISGSK